MSQKMESALARFYEQFDWQPNCLYCDRLKKYSAFTVVGMGGSHLGAWIIKRYSAKYRDIFIHRSYGVPAEHSTSRLFIASSYSGDTEETTDAMQIALSNKMPVVAISTGGRLIEMALDHGIPHVVMPSVDIEPRMAIGYAMLGIATLMQDAELSREITIAGKEIDSAEGSKIGAIMAKKIRGKIPVVLASADNAPLAYIWKIKFNETSKIPAFCNTVPEFCHNELAGYDVAESTKNNSKNLHFILLKDSNDHQRIQLRMRLLERVLRGKGFEVEVVDMSGVGIEKALRAALLADWVSLSLADYYHVPNPETPIIAEFKSKLCNHSDLQL